VGTADGSELDDAIGTDDETTIGDELGDRDGCTEFIDDGLYE
jgi:hypothetical protein